MAPGNRCDPAGGNHDCEPGNAGSNPAQAGNPGTRSQKYKEEPEITVYLHQSNTTEKMPLEKYLEGVVAAEIGPKFPEEALKAQAIVARTMTMAKIIRGGVRDEHNTDTCDLPEHFQAYSRAKVTPEISKAVKETRGQVLLYNGKFVYALFHSYAGPRTASLQESFPELSDIAGAYTEVVDSPGAKYAPPGSAAGRLRYPNPNCRPSLAAALI